MIEEYGQGFALPSDMSKIKTVSFSVAFGLTLIARASFAADKCWYSIHVPDAITRGAIALTFDDGPNPATTPKVLEILKKHGIKATFFMVGTNAAANPELVKRVKAEGHLVANHSYDHKDFHTLTDEQVRVEIEKTDGILRPLVGPVEFFRFPQGFSTCFGRDISHKAGSAVLGWDIDTCDWVYSDGKVTDLEAQICDLSKEDRADFFKMVMKRVDRYGGGVMLMHDIHQHTVANLERILQALEARGYKFVLPNDRAYFPKVLDSVKAASSSLAPAAAETPIPARVPVPTPRPKNLDVPSKPAAETPTAYKSATLPEAIKRMQARDLQQNCSPATLEGWEGFPVVECKYDVRGTAGKVGHVFLLKVSEEKWTQWMASACKAAGAENGFCYRALSDRILFQSGGQIPLRGIVWEDVNPEDGEYESYCFRDGLPIRVTGLESRLTRPLTDDEMNLCMTGPVEVVSRFARPIGLHPKEYEDLTGTKDLYLKDKREGTMEWLRISREGLQEGMRTGNNPLITLWAKMYLRKLPKN